MPFREALSCKRIALRGGMAFYECGKNDTPCSIDLFTGAVDCECGAFKYHGLKKSGQDRAIPTIGTPRYQCKHLLRAVADCIERGEITLE